MTRKVSIPEIARLAPLQYGFFDDFQGFLTADSTAYYTVVTAVDGTVLLLDATAGGVAILSATATASGNEDTYLVREPESFIFSTKPFVFEALVQITEDDTNQNNVFVGLTNAAAADLLVNDGAGVRVTGNTVGFYKVDGGLNWHVYARDEDDALVVTTELTAANSLDGAVHVASGAAKQQLNFEWIPRAGTLGDIVWSIDGVAVFKTTDFDFGANVTSMQAAAGVKDGDSDDLVTLNLFYWFCYQVRA